jgi:pilus assembly protein Flp/PilA
VLPDCQPILRGPWEGYRKSLGESPKGEQVFNSIQMKALLVLGGLKEREEGQALVEYALIISLIAIVAITALQLTGTRVTTILNQIANAL